MKLFLSSRKRILIPLFIAEFISTIFVVYVAKLFGEFTDDVINNGIKKTYWKLIIIVIITIFHFLIMTITLFFENLAMIDIAKKIMKNKLKTNKKFETIWNETNAYVYDYIGPKINIFWSCFLIIASLITLLVTSWIMAVTMLFALVFVYFVPKMFSKKLSKINKEKLKNNNVMNSKLTLAEINYQTISIKNNEMGKLVEPYSLKMANLSRKQMFFSSIRNIISTFSIELTYLIAIIISGILIFVGKASIGILVTTSAIIGGFIFQLPNLSSLVADRKNNKWVTKIKDDFDNEYINKELHKEAIQSLTAINISKEFNDKKVLDNISFTFDKVNNIAFIGKNGSGKTTMARIICRIEINKEGNVLINDKNNPKYQNISCMYQTSTLQLLPGTIKDNIILFNNKLINKEKLLKLAKELGIAKILNKNIKNISSGETALTKIASIIYSEAGIKVYDELLMNVDKNKRDKVLELILNQNSINIIISHAIPKINSSKQLLMKKFYDSKMLIEY